MQGGTAAGDVLSHLLKLFQGDDLSDAHSNSAFKPESGPDRAGDVLKDVLLPRCPGRRRGNRAGSKPLFSSAAETGLYQ